MERAACAILLLNLVQGHRDSSSQSQQSVVDSGVHLGQNSLVHQRATQTDKQQRDCAIHANNPLTHMVHSTYG